MISEDKRKLFEEVQKWRDNTYGRNGKTYIPEPSPKPYQPLPRRKREYLDTPKSSFKNVSDYNKMLKARFMDRLKEDPQVYEDWKRKNRERAHKDYHNRRKWLEP